MASESDLSFFGTDGSGTSTVTSSSTIVLEDGEIPHDCPIEQPAAAVSPIDLLLPIPVIQSLEDQHPILSRVETVSIGDEAPTAETKKKKQHQKRGKKRSHEGDDAPEETGEVVRKRHFRPKVRAKHRIYKEQRRSHLDQEMTGHTFKSGLRQVGNNFKRRKLFSAAAHNRLKDVFVAEVREIATRASDSMTRSGQKMLLVKDLVLASLEHLNPNIQNWSKEFNALRHLCLETGDENNEEISKRYTKILHSFSYVTNEPENDNQ